MAASFSGNLVTPSLESLETEEAGDIELEHHNGTTPLLGQEKSQEKSHEDMKDYARNSESQSNKSGSSPSMHTCNTFEFANSNDDIESPNEIQEMPGGLRETKNTGYEELPQPQIYNKCKDKRMSTVSMASFVAVLAPYINNFTSGSQKRPQDDAEQALKKLCQSPMPRSATFLSSRRTSHRRGPVSIPTRTSSRAINDWSQSLDATFNTFDHDLEESTSFRIPELPDVPTFSSKRSRGGIWNSWRRRSPRKTIAAAVAPSDIGNGMKESKRHRFKRLLRGIFNGNPETEVTTPSVIPPVR